LVDAAEPARYSEEVKYEPRLHVVLHQPEIPPNAGNTGRTCVAVGAKLWMVRPLGFRVDDHHLRRAGLDYWEHLEWEVVENWEAITDALPDRRFWYFTKRAERVYTTADFQRGDVLVFGSETRGLPAALIDTNPETALRIPTRPQVRSLNLGSAAAVAIYEAVRQMGDDFA
jgi:tRNA (cytidine/uridine-2'-O-)-methyltransferase